jgi:hypothetical protein
MMAFRKGGKVKQGDRINFGQERLRAVKFYKYLGIILQISGKTFNLHSKEKAASAVHAMADIQSLSKLPLARGVKLFDLKIVPLFTNSLGGSSLTTLQT